MNLVLAQVQTLQELVCFQATEPHHYVTVYVWICPRCPSNRSTKHTNNDRPHWHSNTFTSCPQPLTLADHGLSFGATVEPVSPTECWFFGCQTLRPGSRFSYWLAIKPVLELAWCKRKMRHGDTSTKQLKPNSDLLCLNQFMLIDLATETKILGRLGPVTSSVIS